MVWILFILALNLVISWGNARACGMAWVEASAIGGFGKVVLWSAAIQSALGFTMVIMFGEAGLAALFIDKGVWIATHLISIGYLAMILPLLGTGTILLTHSWIEAYKRRDIGSIGTAAYNSIAMYHNVSGSGQGIAQGASALGDLFEGEDGWKIALVLMGLIIAFGLGIFTTYSIIQAYKGSLGFLGTFEEEAK